MPRVKRGTVRRAKRKKLEKLTKGYFQNKSKLYKFMKEAAEKAGVYAYAGRKQKKPAASRRSATTAACGWCASTPPRASTASPTASS